MTPCQRPGCNGAMFTDPDRAFCYACGFSIEAPPTMAEKLLSGAVPETALDENDEPYGPRQRTYPKVAARRLP